MVPGMMVFIILALFVQMSLIMTTTEITGAAIIIGSCLVIVWRELVRGRAAKSSESSNS